MGRQPARNAANLAALAGLLPKPKERPSRPNPNHQQDSGGSAVGERPHWSPPAQGDHDPAGDPRRRRFSGVDSAANSNSAFKARQNGEALLLSDLIVRSGVPRASVQHGDPDGPGEEEEVEEGKQQKGEWQKDQIAASRWNLAGEQSDLLEESEEVSSSASALSPLRKLIRSPWNFITSPWKNRGLPPRLGRGGGPKKRGEGAFLQHPGLIQRLQRTRRPWKLPGDWDPGIFPGSLLRMTLMHPQRNRRSQQEGKR